MRPVLARLLRAVPRGAANAVGRALPEFLLQLPFDRLGDRAHKLARVVHLENVDAIYATLARISDDADRLVLGAGESTTPSRNVPTDIDPSLNPVIRMMLGDIAHYLPDDILTKVDRATMSYGLEAREPLLDSALAELAFRLPSSMRIRDGERKWILRRVLERRVPRALFERPKTGFSVPLLRWLRGPLRSWAEERLDPARIGREGYLDPTAVRALWADTLAGRRGGDAAEIWSVLMFESWLAEQERL
jgi:asparagine synthase (glutamine-hydrolysing)